MKSPCLEDEELTFLVNQFKENSKKGDPRLNALLYHLGTAKAVKFRDFVESFLRETSYPSISAMALRTLTNYWGLTKDYLNEIKVFSKGVDWDPDEDLRIAAIRAAGKYLRNIEDKELLNQLIKTLENANESKPVRDAAYWALGDAVGKNRSSLIAKEKIDSTVLEKAIQMLE